MSFSSTKTSAANIIGCMELLMQRGLHMDIENKMTKEIPILHACMDEKVQEWLVTELTKGVHELKTRQSIWQQMPFL